MSILGKVFFWIIGQAVSLFLIKIDVLFIPFFFLSLIAFKKYYRFKKIMYKFIERSERWKMKEGELEGRKLD